MANITNTEVFGLASSIYRSGYPMMDKAPTANEFRKNVEDIEKCIAKNDVSNPHIKRAIKLGNAKGGGHDQFLTGITVTFDLTISNKALVEAERYTFLNFISSMSSMHRASVFKIGSCCNNYVSDIEIKEAERLQKIYNDINEKLYTDDKKQAYLNLLYNMPSGFELMAGMVTNYRCLKNIYAQRKNHRLPDWRIVCDWIEKLPYFKELCLGD